MEERIKIVTSRFRVYDMPSCNGYEGACEWLRGDVECKKYYCEYHDKPLFRCDIDRIVPDDDCPYWKSEVEVING